MFGDRLSIRKVCLLVLGVQACVTMSGFLTCYWSLCHQHFTGKAISLVPNILNTFLKGKKTTGSFKIICRHTFKYSCIPEVKKMVSRYVKETRCSGLH